MEAVYDWATHADREANKYTFANTGRQGRASGTDPVGTHQHLVTTISWRDVVVWCNDYNEALGKTLVYKYSNAVLRTSGNSNADSVTIDSSADGFRLPNEAVWRYITQAVPPK